MDPGHWSTAATTDEECTIELIKIFIRRIRLSGCFLVDVKFEDT